MAIDVKQIINACIAANTQEMDDFFFDDDQYYATTESEPDDEIFLRMENKKASKPDVEPKKSGTSCTFGVPRSLIEKKGITYLNIACAGLRRPIYAVNGEKKGNPIISGDATTVTCNYCGKEHYISDLHLKGETNVSDAIFALINLYNFATKCECGKYVYGYFEQPKPTENEWFLDEICEEEKVKKTKKTSTKTSRASKSKFGEQLTFFDAYPEMLENNSEKVSRNNISTLSVSIENVPPTLEEKMEAVAALNSELEKICDTIYSDEAYSERINSFNELSMKELINEAKAREGVKNFMRMSKKEIISCLIFYDDQMTDKLNPLLTYVGDRTCWLYGKYKDIK